MDNELIRKIPNMNTVLDHPQFSDLDREQVKSAARRFFDGLRNDIAAGKTDRIPDIRDCVNAISEMIADDGRAGMRGLINATGIVLHTNLGRAPLGREVYAAAEKVYSGYSNLEFDLDSGERGSRCVHIEKLICQLSGAEAAMAVNNNAAAVFLALAALAKGKKVAISRGELVEIGGSFRVPEIMAQSGAELMEVGCTNKTRLSDYEAAIEAGAELLLKVHTSNYRILGFVGSVSVRELSALGREKGIPLIYDMGSCFLAQPDIAGAGVGRTARSGIESGADLICFSGDKLAGTAQAGMIAGRKEYIEILKKHPLARIVRPDKLTLSALESTLRLWRYPDAAKSRIPAVTMLSYTAEELRDRAEALADKIRAACPEWETEVCPTVDEAGGGSLPGTEFAGWAAAIDPKGLALDEFERLMRLAPTPVVLRLHDQRALISPRTLLPGEEEALMESLTSVYAQIYKTDPIMD